jgi:hypothetical protein
VEGAADSQVQIRRIAAVVAAIVVVVIAYLLISGGDDDDSGSDVVAADATEVQELAADLGRPVYWAGPTGAETFEWTALSDGRTYIRYLTGGAEVEDPRPLYLTVATYPVGDGVKAVKTAARSADTKTVKAPGGAIAYAPKNTSSVYVAYPGSEYQIEVFDPDPKRALKLVRAGRIQLVL